MGDAKALLSREIQAAIALRDALRDMGHEDAEFIRDAIEGETNIHELVAAVAAEDALDNAIIDGIGELQLATIDRKERIAARVAYRRELLLKAMEAAGLTKLATPAGTVSVGHSAPKVIVIAEDEIPEQFIKVIRQPDKRAIGDALKAGEFIPGARLSNSEPSIRIRRA